MKIVKLQGGLGNQMFQYAIARTLETNKKKDIFLDLSFLRMNNVSTDCFTARDFELSIFPHLRAKKLNSLQKRFLLSDRVRYKFIRKIANINFHKINQLENEIVEIPFGIKNVYLDGFFQSESYFKHIRFDLIKDFQFPELDTRNEALKKTIVNNNSVSIHIRRGDYVYLKNANTYHGVLGLEYYQNAIKSMEEEANELLSFFIFSDDPEYASKNLSFLPNMQIVDWNLGKNSWKDMALMLACKHHIIANSSFSWWGAWLSERNGITYAPVKWFNNESQYNINNIIPSDWVII